MKDIIKEIKDVRLYQDKKYNQLLYLEELSFTKYEQAKKEREEYYKNN